MGNKLSKTIGKLKGVISILAMGDLCGGDRV